MKRLFDLILCLLGFLFFAIPLMILTGLVYVNLGRPIFFCQMRPGLNGKPFKMIKFRTMSNKKSSNGALLPDAARLTRFGNFMRATSLDEIPTLLNVLRGDMSMVGPRPLLLEYLPRYTPEQARRHTVVPGITGWAQVNGRNAITWEKKFQLDLWYIDNQTLVLDLKILLLTFKKVVLRDGINPKNELTTPEFRGGQDE